MKLKGYFFLRPEGREDICTCPMPDKSKQNGTYEEIHNLMIDFSESAKEIGGNVCTGWLYTLIPEEGDDI
jgi:hypothetical protein